MGNGNRNCPAGRYRSRRRNGFRESDASGSAGVSASWDKRDCHCRFVSSIYVNVQFHGQQRSFLYCSRYLAALLPSAGQRKGICSIQLFGHAFAGTGRCRHWFSGQVDCSNMELDNDGTGRRRGHTECAQMVLVANEWLGVCTWNLGRYAFVISRSIFSERSSVLCISFCLRSIAIRKHCSVIGNPTYRPGHPCQLL